MTALNLTRCCPQPPPSHAQSKLQVVLTNHILEQERVHHGETEVLLLVHNAMSILDSVFKEPSYMKDQMQVSCQELLVRPFCIFEKLVLRL